MSQSKESTNMEEKNTEKSDSDVAHEVNAFGVRHVQIVMMFFLLAIGIGMRVQLSVAVVAMTDNSTTSNPNVPVYNWTNKSVVLSSFYWSYFILQIGAGALGKRYGTKKMLLYSMGVNAALCALVPLAAANLGSYGVMICRIIQGLSQGFFYPCVVNLLGGWCPAPERSRLGAIAFAGGSFGTIVSQPVVGYISSTWIGWPATFYIYGSIGLLWMIFYTIYGANSPAEHKSISVGEKNYIESFQDSSDKEIKFKDIPWKPIFTSMPLWALTISYFGQVWIGITQSTELPTYLNKVMKFDVASDGIVSSIPDLVIVIVSYPVAYVADYVIEKKYLSIGTTRILLTVIPIIAASASILFLTYLPDDAHTVAIIILILNGALNGLSFSGSLVNHVDLSPKYSGVIMSISNSLSMIIAPLAPLVVQAIVTDETNSSQWRTVFIITVIITTLTHVLYTFCGSGEVQWWNFYVKGEDRPEIPDLSEDEMLKRRSSLISIPVGI